MIEIVACSGRGVCPEQQDALAIGPDVIQSSNHWSHAHVYQTGEARLADWDVPIVVE